MFMNGFSKKAKQYTRARLRRRNQAVTLLSPLLLIIVISLACGLPGTDKSTPAPVGSSPTPTQVPTPTATPEPLPPGLVESSPFDGGSLPLEGPITLYFNQAMERASVEATLASQLNQPVNFTWLDDSTVVIYISAPLPPETAVNLNLGAEVRSISGMGVSQPVSLNFLTAGLTRLAQTLPERGARAVDPSSAVSVSFNRPITPLGADPQALAPAFRLQPEATGKGEWVNTSTYVFYPQPPLAGGVQYTVSIDPELKSADGSPLQDNQPWSFTTAEPSLVKIEPASETAWPLDPEVRLTFNQPMDPVSVEANFSLSGPDGKRTPGSSSWNEDKTIYTFQPDVLLERDTIYTLKLDSQAGAQGGTQFRETASITVITVPALKVSGTGPAQSGEFNPYNSVEIFFTAPIQAKDVLDYVSTVPAVADLGASWDEAGRVLRLYGTFMPNSNYEIRISAGLQDAWGGRLDEDFVYDLNTTSLEPRVTMMMPYNVIFVTAQEASIPVQASNVSSLPMSIGEIPPLDLIELFGQDGYNMSQGYEGVNTLNWTQALATDPNQVSTINLYLSPDKKPLKPGIYMMRFKSQLPGIYGGPYYLTSSNIQTTLKLGASDALVWAVDLRSGAPLANAPVEVYNYAGALLAAGQTDEQGLFYQAFDPQLTTPYGSGYAFIGQPGQENFGMAMDNWSFGVAAEDFRLSTDRQAPYLKLYFYTDRPIYRPGQKVFFRVAARSAFDGRYSLPEKSSLPVKITGPLGETLASLELPLSAVGTASGEYQLSSKIAPGVYMISSPDASHYNSMGYFEVASYRKPEINLQVDFDTEQALAGEILKAHVNARYFFDAPASNVKLRWTLSMLDSSFYLPDYRVGPLDTGWLQAYTFPGFGRFGKIVSEGESETLPDGTLELEFDPEIQDSRQEYTLEVTAVDESGMPVSARDDILVNPAPIFIGVRAEAWTGRAGEESFYNVQLVDWQGEPAGAQALRAEFRKVVWVEDPTAIASAYLPPPLIPQYTAVGSSDFSTNQVGQARLSFTPPQPGNYQLDVYDPQDPEAARTQVLTWVGGPGEVVWPQIPNSRLRLTADKASYQAGDTARIYIPNPYGIDAPVLITTERGRISMHQAETLPAAGKMVELPLNPGHAPNLYLSVTLLGKTAEGLPDFRQGFLNLPVEPVEQKLTVTLTNQPERAGPGDEVAYEILVTDSAGKPVQGEFSLAVVDLAVLALAEPNSKEISAFFYDIQPLGVLTGNTLAVYARRQIIQPVGGLGGGGGEGPSVARQDFPDTAYWNATIITGADGRAQVSFSLPDTLTTWRADARGLTSDTRVGQAEARLVTTKDLLVRPVTPRFVVAGDHLQMAAIVQNNTTEALQAEVSLSANGFELDDAGTATQRVSVPANGRTRVEWNGVVQDAPGVELQFSASAQDSSGKVLEDTSLPAMGVLPVRSYFAPQSFRTAGTLDSGGEIRELVSLPRSFDPQAGELEIEMASSLAGGMLGALDVLEHAPQDSVEAALSSFLPNLETYRTLKQFGIDDAGLQSRLDRTLNEGLVLLQSRQNYDGGWPWWKSGASDPFTTAYVLFGLSRAREAGIQLDEGQLQRAVDYLRANPVMPPVEGSVAPAAWQIERQIFIEFALTQLGQGNVQQADALYLYKEQVSPWANALLSLTLETLSPGSAEATTLLSNLETTALRSAAGAYWEIPQSPEGLEAAQRNWQTTLSNTAGVLYALARRNPGSPLVTDAVRFLMANRSADGSWNATYTTSWSLMALNEVIKGTGELGGDFSFNARLNKNDIAQGEASGTDQLTPVTAQVALQRLFPDYPNALDILRSDGAGRLYYNVVLNVSRPVENAAPLSQGLMVSRSYRLLDQTCEGSQCPPVQTAAPGDRLLARLTLTAPHDLYFVSLEDYIPAGAEILDTSLKTSEMNVEDAKGLPQQVVYDPRNPFAEGWGWWYFNTPQIYDDHIAWTANTLPAGTYEITYILTALIPGDFRVLPAHAWQLYFPEVQALSAGEVFEIK
jgi:hypothetical protein